MRTPRIASLLVAAIMIVFAVTCGRVSAFPLGWGHPCVIDSSSARKGCVQGLIDPVNEWQYVFWHDSDDSIRYRSRDMDSLWTTWGPTYAVAHASWDAFGAAADSSGNLHVVWADGSEIEPLGETSNLFYMEITPWSKDDTIYNITPGFNVPSEEDSLVEDFEGGVMPPGWGTEGSANNDGDGPWGLWSVQNGQGVDGSYCAVGRCATTGWPRGRKFCLFMPPVTIPECDTANAEFSFCFRVDRDDSLRLRVVGFEGFPLQNHLDLTTPNKIDRQFVLWDSLITNTKFATAAVCFADSADSLEGEFLHLVFEVYSGVTGAAPADTMVRVCVDDVAFRG